MTDRDSMRVEDTSLTDEVKAKLRARDIALHYALRDTRERRTPEEALEVARQYEHYLAGPLSDAVVGVS